MATIRFIKRGKYDEAQLRHRGYQIIASFDDGDYWAKGSNRQLETVQCLVDDVFGAGVAKGVKDAQAAPLTPDELKAVTA